ncbi:MAG TPA: NADH-quinone oxidoreductase subunit L [Deltaproteobacteria bacterium]|nr:MAG: NADH-quinone oxidoreductase subunit L [Deltaproteobacteria bacterium GWA2_45_12]HBF11976.1 NADH-quinone oxidoreductase subunit L [Deltaproteobacteria bacterium]
MISFSNTYLYLIPAFPLLGFVVNALLSMGAARRGKGFPEIISSVVACAMPTLSFGIALWAFCILKGLPENGVLQPEPLFSWISTSLIQIPFSFVFDHLSAVMVLVVTGVGSLIHYYSVGYMKGDVSYSRYLAYLNLFLFFMLLLVLGDNLLVLFVGWEGVGLCSYFLIGFWFTDAEKAKAGKKAFVVNRIGDFGFLVGLFYLVKTCVTQNTGEAPLYLSYSFLISHQEWFLPIATVMTLCFFVGATGKSAQIPLYIWLPDAMAGPTPVSALIHAATMVTAGIYMVARLFFLFHMAPLTLHIIALVGLATAVLAALIAITQYDIKKVLAYSTVSQLGYMFLALGVGAPQAALFHVVTHAFFKACLFLGAGSVIYAMHHEQDIRNMGGLFKKVPVTAFAFLVSTLAIAGIPPFAGFFSKDEILLNVYLHAPLWMYVTSLVAAGLTAFYMFRLFVYVFLGHERKTHNSHDHHEEHHSSQVPWIMDAPVAILGLLAILGGFLGVPEVLHGSNHFHHWLSFLTEGVEAHHVSHSLELTLMAVSTGWALLLSLTSLKLYSANLNWTAPLKNKFAPLYQLMQNKFYVDEVYTFLIVKPLLGISRVVLWKGADQKLIDGVLVHGWSGLSQFGAQALAFLQTGYLGHYLVLLTLGVVVLLVCLLGIF